MYLKQTLHPDVLHHEFNRARTRTHTHTLIMLLLRGISALPSEHREVLLASTPVSQPDVTGDPGPSLSSPGPHSPFTTSHCVLPASSSSPGTLASPTFNGDGLPSSPNSAMGTWSTPVHTCTRGLARCRARLCLRWTPGSWLQ